MAYRFKNMGLRVTQVVNNNNKKDYNLGQEKS